jgi:hypothetical protein
MIPTDTTQVLRRPQDKHSRTGNVIRRLKAAYEADCAAKERGVVRLLWLVALLTALQMLMLFLWLRAVL